MNTEIKSKIEELVNEYNQLKPQSDKAQQRLIEIQGAVAALNSMVPEETPPETTTDESEPA